MNIELTQQNSWHTNGIKRFVTDESLYFGHEHPTSNMNTVILTLPIKHLPLLIILLSPNICMILLLNIIVYVMKWIISPITCPIVLSLNIDVCKTIHSPTVHRSRKQ